MKTNKQARAILARLPRGGVGMMATHDSGGWWLFSQSYIALLKTRSTGTTWLQSSGRAKRGQNTAGF